MLVQLYAGVAADGYGASVFEKCGSWVDNEVNGRRWRCTKAGHLGLRSKRELIEEFIEQNLPAVGSAAEIPDSFEDFWAKERLAAFDRLCKEEQLDAGKVTEGDRPVCLHGGRAVAGPRHHRTDHPAFEAGGARADAEAGAGQGGGVRAPVYPGNRGVMGGAFSAPTLSSTSMPPPAVQRALWMRAESPRGLVLEHKEG
jgi:hypothetical protein